jgi:hypothetical protein
MGISIYTLQEKDFFESITVSEIPVFKREKPLD